MNHLRKLFTDKRGVSAIEYALIASLISVAAIAGYHSLGDKVQNSFANTSDKL
jgi:pilus assembly protein Flp/PilA